MRALVIGRGSMGKRRIRDLTALGVEVESWDNTDSGTLPEEPFDAVIVSTPPMLHEGYVRPDTPTFTEADVEAIAPRHVPSATPLFTDWYPLIVEAHKDHSIIGYSLHVGQHIDDWHPGADPKTYYAYKDETGPTREMIPFELIWLTKVLGPVQDANGFREPDVAHATVLHSGGAIGNLFIDARSRPAVRKFDFVAADGQQRVWNLNYLEEVYAREMRAFVSAVEGRATWPYTQAEEAANLEVLHTIERSG